MASVTEHLDYEIGYKKPPVGGRFQKGKSGNPRGRPKGSVNHLAVLRRVLDQTVTVIADGKRNEITKIAAGLTEILNKAAQGDSRAFETVMKIMTRLGIKLREEEKKGNVTFIIEG